MTRGTRRIQNSKLYSDFLLYCEELDKENSSEELYKTTYKGSEHSDKLFLTKIEIPFIKTFVCFKCKCLLDYEKNMKWLNFNHCSLFQTPFCLTCYEDL